MKKRIVGHLGVVALALTLVSMTLMGGTVARYTTTVSGSAEATVAKFAFDLNGMGASTSTQRLDMSTLFKNAYGAGNEVKGSDSKKVIAPGTSGFIKIELKNESEVVIKPVFSVNVELADGIKDSFPIEYAMSSSETAPTDEKEWGATDSDC